MKIAKRVVVAMLMITSSFMSDHAEANLGQPPSITSSFTQTFGAKNATEYCFRSPYTKEQFGSINGDVIMKELALVVQQYVPRSVLIKGLIEVKFFASKDRVVACFYFNADK